MRKFREFLKSKFVWGPKDVEHEKDSKEDRATRFIWKPTDLEHHDGPLREEALEEKHKPIAHDAKGNYANPHHIGDHTPTIAGSNKQNPEHPYVKSNSKNKIGAPEKGSAAHEHYLAHHASLSYEEHKSGEFYKGSGAWDVNIHLREAGKHFQRYKKAYINQHKLHGGPHVGEPLSNTSTKYANQTYYKNSSIKKQDTHLQDMSHRHITPPHLEPHIKNLDKITSNKTPEHHVVFRGGHPGDIHRFPIGHEFTDHGYVSTSFNHHTAHLFSDSSHKTGRKIVHVIHVPKGSKAHYFDVNGYPTGAADEKHVPAHHHWGNASEAELVLHRGTKFKVTHHTATDDTHYIHSKVVRQGIQHKFVMDRPQKHTPPGQKTFPFMKSKNEKV